MKNTRTCTLSIVCCLGLLGPAIAFAKEAPTTGTAAESTVSANEVETQRLRRVEQAQTLIHEGEPEQAIEILDAVIAEYERQYPDGETRWYVARDTAETLAYMVSAAANPDGRHKQASALIVMWAEAYYLKGYALVELAAGNGGVKTAKTIPDTDPARLAQAKKALERGIRLAPYHARMLSELGQIQQLEKDWDTSLRTFRASEEAVAFSPEDEKKSVLGRAKRGAAFSLIELGRLDEAAKVLNQCLELNPDDGAAKRELAYIRSLREQPQK